MPPLQKKRSAIPRWQFGVQAVISGILISGVYYYTFTTVIDPREKANKIAAEAREKRLEKKDE